MSSRSHNNFHKQDTTPLELLNLYLTEGRSRGNSSNKLYQKFNKELSWDAMLNKGYQADLAPLLYYIIEKSNLNLEEIRVCPETINRLESMYRQHLPVHLMQFNELENILKTFEKEDIDVIPLKGAELAKNYYPHQAVRPMSDIDLLIRTEHMNQAKECLLKKGYTFKGSRIFPDEDSYKKYHFHYPFVKYNKICSIVVELHQNIAKRSNFDFIENNIGEFWKNFLPTNNDTHVRTIPKELLLLHVFWHTYHNLSQSLYVRFIWLLDIVFVLRKHRDEIDWRFVEEKARKWGIQKQVYFCLHLITQLFNAVFDMNVLRKSKLSDFSMKLFDCVMLDNIQNIKDPNRIYIIVLHLIVLNSPYMGIKYFSCGRPKNHLSYRERIRRKYKLSSKTAVYLFYVIHPIIFTLMGFKWLFKIFWGGTTDKFRV